MIQVKGIMKLLGLSYTIQYNKGKENQAVDVLSRRDTHQEEELSSMTATVMLM